MPIKFVYTRSGSVDMPWSSASKLKHALRALLPIGLCVAQLHQQLSARHCEAELFLPMTELLLTDRLLCGTPQLPAPLTSLEQLEILSVVQNLLFIRVVGEYKESNFGGSYRITREDHIDLQGPTPTGIDGW